MWVKICGNTNLEDAQHAAEAGANAVGFVFAASPRQVNTATVRNIVPQLTRTVETYGVFVDSSAEEIVRVVSECGLTGVQLHRVPSAERRLAEKLRQRFLALHMESVKIISVLSFEDPAERPFADQMQEALEGADAVLVDTKSAKAVGGTGTSFDWKAASASFHENNGRMRVIAAGGLNAGNVVEAVQTLRPWGVDVVTGVEAMPGRKDAQRVEDFVRAARSGAKA